MWRAVGYGCIVFWLACTLRVDAVELVPLSQYAAADDSMFVEFGVEGTLRIEDFEDGVVNEPGVVMRPLDGLTTGVAAVTVGHAVRADGPEGKALEVTPTSCALSFPPRCPATVSFAFDAEALGLWPNYVGFVWTNAVRADAMSALPWLQVTVATADGDEQETLIHDLPVRDPLADGYADDTLISFRSDAGIHRLDVTVITDNRPENGHLALDHLQFGLAATAGDTDVDGDVDFVDFTQLSGHFGGPADWSQGDFDFNGQADFVDFLSLSQNFGHETVARWAAVPEPGWGTAWGVGGLLLGWSARRGRRA